MCREQQGRRAVRIKRHGAQDRWQDEENISGTTQTSWATRERVTSCVTCGQNVCVCTCNVGRCSIHSPRRLPGIWKFPASEKQLTEHEKSCRNTLLVWRGATSFPMLISTLTFLTVQSKLKIANNPNFDSTSIHRSAATARMKTNLLKNKNSIQFEGGPFRRTPRGLQIVVEDFVFFVALDGSAGFLVRYFQHVLCKVNNKRASLHGNQVFVLSDV